MSLPILDPEYNDDAWWALTDYYNESSEEMDAESQSTTTSTTMSTTMITDTVSTTAEPEPSESDGDMSVQRPECTASCLIALIAIVMTIFVICLFVIVCLAVRYKAMRRQRSIANEQRGPVVIVKEKSPTPKELEAQALAITNLLTTPSVTVINPPPYRCSDDPIPPPQYTSVQNDPNGYPPSIQKNENPPEYAAIEGGSAPY